MTRDKARDILFELTKTESLRRHARTVELVMEAMAKHFGEDVEKFAITGLLHDADYEKFPDQHPNVIVEKLNGMGEAELAHAIAGHYTKWNVPRNSLLDKCIVAADELTGFIVASALVRPTRIVGLGAKSVMKKFKTKTFAASVDRDEVRKGAELIGWELRDLITFIITVLEENKEELELESVG
ncbi:HD domain-containing protein [Saprospiraceae bacterium]|jgi:predicted hydrolase (HD superfamily)|nr:HD domain-containing protein [Bacteroidota bacterium]MDB4728331.1 HD domain-containing protein [Saprospiraceae bacterium]MDF1866273.1 HD domain-containing protein [Saprospiraceae bacterium]